MVFRLPLHALRGGGRIPHRPRIHPRYHDAPQRAGPCGLFHHSAFHLGADRTCWTCAALRGRRASPFVRWRRAIEARAGASPSSSRSLIGRLAILRRMQKRHFVLFDFDGVIADSYDIAWMTAQTLCKRVTEKEYKEAFEGNV